MPIPRVRFTVRRMMVAVAIVAAVAGAAAASRRWSVLASAYHVKALYLGLQADLEEENARTADAAIWFARASDPDRPERAAPRYRRRAEFYSLLRGKYERAARYPFLPVAPDPPEPE
jgi:hypothetical protein